MAVIIADGMGVGGGFRGGGADRDAGEAEAGLDLDFAVQSVNAVMLLRSDDDRFTTVDLAVVNLYTGQAEWSRPGPPSFISMDRCHRHRGSFCSRRVQAPTRVMRYGMNLEEGDILIMVSDGITEAVGDGLNRAWSLCVMKGRFHLPRKVAEDVVEWARGPAWGFMMPGAVEARTGSASTRQAHMERTPGHSYGWLGWTRRPGRAGRDERGGSIESIDDITVLAAKLSLADAGQT